MSTVKISELDLLPSIAANTSNTIFLGVDIPSQVTGRFTATVLAQQLYANNILNVGNNIVSLPNTIAQFSLSGDSYIQTNLVNLNDGGTADIVVTASANSGGTDAANFIDMGYANKNYQPGSEYNNIGTAIRPNDGYLYVQGTSGQPYGNLIIGTTSAGANLKFIVGGGSVQNIVAKMTTTGLVMNTQSSITFGDGSVQSVAASPANYTQAAFSLANTNTSDLANTTALTQASFNLANTNSTNITYITGVNDAQNTYSSAAYAKANAALANATGTFAGDLTITGKTVAQTMNTTNLQVNGTANISGIVTMNAQLVLTNTTFSATESALTISGNPLIQLPSNDGYMLHISGKQNVSSRIVADSFGANTYVVFAGRSARGTYSAPSGLINGDILMRISGNGYGTTKYAQYGSARIDFLASENWTDTARGSQIKFYNCATGSNTITEIASFNATDAIFTGTIEPQKGFAYTPKIFPLAQTAISIAFTTDSMIKANVQADLTVSFSDYKTGKVVELWITNTSGTQRTVTHGCSAINSTTNSTTFTIPATSSAYLKYFSIDGDLANTFVSVNHA